MERDDHIPTDREKTIVKNLLVSLWGIDIERPMPEIRISIENAIEKSRAKMQDPAELPPYSVFYNDTHTAETARIKTIALITSKALCYASFMAEHPEALDGANDNVDHSAMAFFMTVALYGLYHKALSCPDDWTGEQLFDAESDTMTAVAFDMMEAIVGISGRMANDPPQNHIDGGKHAKNCKCNTCWDKKNPQHSRVTLD